MQEIGYYLVFGRKDGTMKKKRFTEAQISFALRQAEGGTRVEEIIRKMGICEATFYRWNQKYAGLGRCPPASTAAELLTGTVLPYPPLVMCEQQGYSPVEKAGRPCRHNYSNWAYVSLD